MHTAYTWLFFNTKEQYPKYVLSSQLPCLWRTQEETSSLLSAKMTVVLKVVSWLQFVARTMGFKVSYPLF